MTATRTPRKSDRLIARCRELRERGASPMARREAYNAWFRQRCKEGRRPDALVLHSPDEAERFWARTVPGPDGHVYWTGGAVFYRNGGLAVKPQRWAWRAKHGELSNYVEIQVTCGEKNCVNVEHLQVMPRKNKRAHYPDRAALGALQVLALRLGHAPSKREWDEAKLPVKGGAMALRFGSWTGFIKQAGLTPQGRQHASSPEVCTAAVRALAVRLGRTPSSHDWRNHHDWLVSEGHPSSANTISNQLGGTFAEAVQRALNEKRTAA